MKAVIDTNVLVAALKSRRGASFQLLQMIREKQFTPVLSVPLFLEYEDVLKRPGMVPLSVEMIDRFLNLLAASSQAQPIFFLWRPILRDARDDMVLEVAVAAQCEAIVTFNMKDFAGIHRFGIEALTPHQFILKFEKTK